MLKIGCGYSGNNATEFKNYRSRQRAWRGLRYPVQSTEKSSVKSPESSTYWWTYCIFIISDVAQMFNNDNPIYDSAAEIVEMHGQSLLHLPRNACFVNLYNQKLMRVGNLNQASVTCKLWVKTQEWLEVKMWNYTHAASTTLSSLILPVGQLNYLATQTNVVLFGCAWSNFKRLGFEDSKRVEWIHPIQIQTKCHRPISNSVLKTLGLSTVQRSPHSPWSARQMCTKTRPCPCDMGIKRADVRTGGRFWSTSRVSAWLTGSIDVQSVIFALSETLVPLIVQFVHAGCVADQ